MTKSVVLLSISQISLSSAAPGVVSCILDRRRTLSSWLTLLQRSNCRWHLCMPVFASSSHISKSSSSEECLLFLVPPLAYIFWISVPPYPGNSKSSRRPLHVVGPSLQKGDGRPWMPLLPGASSGIYLPTSAPL